MILCCLGLYVQVGNLKISFCVILDIIKALKKLPVSAPRRTTPEAGCGKGGLPGLPAKGVNWSKWSKLMFYSHFILR